MALLQQKTGLLATSISHDPSPRSSSLQSIDVTWSMIPVYTLHG